MIQEGRGQCDVVDHRQVLDTRQIATIMPPEAVLFHNLAPDLIRGFGARVLLGQDENESFLEARVFQRQESLGQGVLRIREHIEALEGVALATDCPDLLVEFPPRYAFLRRGRPAVPRHLARARQAPDDFQGLL